MQSLRTTTLDRLELLHLSSAYRVLDRLFRFVVGILGNRSNVVGMVVGVLPSAGIVFWLARDWWRHPDL